MERPRLRGRLHQLAFPVALLAGLVLVVVADGAVARLATVVYALGLAGLLGTSALYHRRAWRWSEPARRWLRRLDHAMIFVLIAATATPFALLALEPPLGPALVLVAWGSALVGLVVDLVWPGAPNWVRSAVYVAVGSAGLVAWPALGAVAPTAFVLVVTGNVLYGVGALVYALRRPDPAPRVFGFHEVFHALVVAAAALHFGAVGSVVT